MVTPTAFGEVNLCLGGGLSGLVEIYGDSGAAKTSIVLSCSRFGEVVAVDLDGSLSEYEKQRHGFPLNITHILFPNLNDDSTSDGRKIISILRGTIKHCEVAILDPAMAIAASEWREIIPEIAGICNLSRKPIVVISSVDDMGRSELHGSMQLYATQRLLVKHYDLMDYLNDPRTVDDGSVSAIKFEAIKTPLCPIGRRGNLLFSVGEDDHG